MITVSIFKNQYHNYSAVIRVNKIIYARCIGDELVDLIDCLIHTLNDCLAEYPDSVLKWTRCPYPFLKALFADFVE